MTDQKKHHVGLWISEKQDKNGNPFLKGRDKENDIRYFVFKNKDGSDRLCKAVGEGNLETIGNMEKIQGPNQEFIKIDNYAVLPNGFYEEGTNKPEYNLAIS